MIVELSYLIKTYIIFVAVAFFQVRQNIQKKYNKKKTQVNFIQIFREQCGKIKILKIKTIN